MDIFLPVARRIGKGESPALAVNFRISGNKSNGIANLWALQPLFSLVIHKLQAGQTGIKPVFGHQLVMPPLVNHAAAF